MKLIRCRSLYLCAVAMLFVVPCAVAATTTVSTAQQDAGSVALQRAAEDFGKLPLAFEPNHGQSDAQVDYLSRGSGYTLFLTPGGATFALRRPDAKGADVLRMDLAGASVRPAVSAEGRLPGEVNYLRGSDPAKWNRGVEQFGKVRYHDVYPGVDLVYYGNQGQLEYDFVVNPGAQASKIAFAMPGAEAVHTSKDGALAIQLANGEVRWKAPDAYQLIDGGRQKVEAEYVVMGKAVGFKLGSYDRSRPLVIDPVLVFGSYIGAADQSGASGIAVDSSHNIYVVGTADSSQYPVTGSAYDKTFKGTSDAFVTKLSADGKSLIYSTYLGGSDSDSSYAVAVDSAGNAYVSGETISSDFPVTAGAYHLYGGGATAFVAKLDSTGSNLLYSAEIGTATGRAIAIDSTGNAYVAGGVFGVFKTTPGAYKSSANNGNCMNVQGSSYIFKLNPAGSAPVYSTYVADCEQAYGIAVMNGNAYITGQTENQHPVTPGAVQPSFGGYIDSFATEMNTSGSALVYSTYLGGSLGDFGNGIAIDASGAVIIAGYSDSNNYPTTANALERNNPSRYGEPQSGVVTKLNATGTAFVYSTYLGGSNYDLASAVAVDNAGNAFISGQASSADFPTKDAFQGICGLSSFDSCEANAFVTELSSSGALVASTFYGPSNSWDLGSAIATDNAGGAYIAGQSGNNLPTLNAYKGTTNGDLGTVFLAKLNMNAQTGCTNLRQDRTVVFCTPFVNSTSGPNVEVTALVNDSNPVSAIQVYVDGTFVFEEDTGKQIHSFINMAPGSHSVAIKAWDKNGSFLATRTVNVSGSNTATCFAGDILPYVQICNPLAASAQSNPVQVHATGVSQNAPVTALELYVDGVSYKTVKTNTLDWQGNLASGWRKITVNGWDYKGQVFKQTVWVYVK